MSGFTLTRSLNAPADRVWEIVGNVGASPHGRMRVDVEHQGSPDGSGTLRIVSFGGLSVREEITAVRPGYGYEYRLLGGAPVRDYVGTVSLAERSADRTDIRWTVSFRPRVPGTGPLISWPSRRAINRVLDALADRFGSSP